MKRVMLTFVMILSVLVVQAQKNSLLLYGALNLQSAKTPASTGTLSTKSNTFSISPGIGYQFTDHWTAGINIAASSMKYGSPEVKTSSFGAGPFIRYAYPLSNIFAVYGQLNTNAISGKTADVKMSGFQATLFPAIGVNLKNGFALNFNFGGLGFSSSKPKGGGTATSFGLAFGSGAGFGISKNFGL
jgi:hypothetical protein